MTAQVTEEVTEDGDAGYLGLPFVQSQDDEEWQSWIDWSGGSPRAHAE